MTNKKRTARLLLCICLIGLIRVPVAAGENIGNNTASDAAYVAGTQARAHDIGWRYDVFGGELYKRQYNYTTGEWIGDWIKC